MSPLARPSPRSARRSPAALASHQNGPRRSTARPSLVGQRNAIAFSAIGAALRARLTGDPAPTAEILFATYAAALAVDFQLTSSTALWSKVREGPQNVRRAMLRTCGRLPRCGGLHEASLYGLRIFRTGPSRSLSVPQLVDVLLSRV